MWFIGILLVEEGDKVDVFSEWEYFHGLGKNNSFLDSI